MSDNIHTTASDLWLPQPPPASLAQALMNEALAQEVRAMLASSGSGQRCIMSVSAQNGIVTLDGTCWDDTAHATIKLAVMEIRSVRGVEDRLDWILPDCGVGVAGPH